MRASAAAARSSDAGRDVLPASGANATRARSSGFSARLIEARRPRRLRSSTLLTCAGSKRWNERAATTSSTRGAAINTRRATTQSAFVENPGTTDGGWDGSKGLCPIARLSPLINGRSCSNVKAIPEMSTYREIAGLSDLSVRLSGRARHTRYRTKYTTSPNRPDKKDTDSKTIARTASRTSAGGTINRYCFTNTHGSSGASWRTRSMAIELTMNPVVNTARKTRLPAAFATTYSPLRIVVDEMTRPPRERTSRLTAFEIT